MDINIARIIYDHYPSAGEMIPEEVADDLGALYAWARQHDFGDTLLKFIILEAHEGGESTDGSLDPQQVHDCLSRARDDLEQVLGGLAAALDLPTEVLDAEPARTWRCSGCGRTVRLTQDDLADIGNPICGEPDCPNEDEEMELLPLPTNGTVASARQTGEKGPDPCAS